MFSYKTQLGGQQEVPCVLSTMQSQGCLPQSDWALNHSTHSLNTNSDLDIQNGITHPLPELQTAWEQQPLAEPGVHKSHTEVSFLSYPWLSVWV